MTLTRDDLRAIQQVVVDTTMPMFEQVFERFDRLETRMDRVEKGQDEHNRILDEHTTRLRNIETKVDNIDGRLQAVEADIKELYQMVANPQQQKTSKLSKLSAEQKVVKAYQDLIAVATELNITLPTK